MKVKKLFLIGALLASIFLITGCEEMDTTGIFNDTPNNQAYDSTKVVGKIDKTLAQTLRSEVETGNGNANKSIPSLEARINAIDKKCKTMSQSEFEKMIKNSILDVAFQMNKMPNNSSSGDPYYKSKEKLKKYTYEYARKNMKGFIKDYTASEDDGTMYSTYGLVVVTEKAIENSKPLTDKSLADIPDEMIYTFLDKRDGDYFRPYINQKKLTDVSKTLPDYFNQMFAMVSMFGQLSGQSNSITIQPVSTVGGLNSYAAYIVGEILTDKSFVEKIKTRKLPEYIKELKEGSNVGEDGTLENINLGEDKKIDIKTDTKDNSNGITEFKFKFRIK